MLEKPKPVWKQNLRYGGNVWLGFFGSFYIDVSPMLGYDVTGKGTVLGVGVPFIYQGQYRQAASIAVGGRVFIRQAVWRSIFLHGEYEYMNANKESFFNKKPGESTRQWGGSPLIGAGFYQGRTRLQKGSFISVLFNTAAPNKGFISPQSLGGPDSPFVIRLGYFF